MIFHPREGIRNIDFTRADRFDLGAFQLHSCLKFLRDVEIPPGFPVGGDFRTHGKARVSIHEARSGRVLMNQADFTLDDFGEGDVCDAHTRAGGNQRGTSAVELFDSLGDQVDQYKWVGDNFRGLIKEIAFHR